MMSEYTNEDRVKKLEERRKAAEEAGSGNISEAEALMHEKAGRPVDWSRVDGFDEEGNPTDSERREGLGLDGEPSDADVQQYSIHQDHTQNADLESQAAGEYADATEAVEEAVEGLDEDATAEEAQEAVADAIPEGMTEAELQDAQRRGMVEEAENPRNEAQQKALKAQVENAEGGEVTDEGLRKPENVEYEDESDDEPEPGSDEAVAGAADEGHEVPATEDETEDEPAADAAGEVVGLDWAGMTVADAEGAVKDATDADLEEALKDHRVGVQKAAEAEQERRKG